MKTFQELKEEYINKVNKNTDRRKVLEEKKRKVEEQIKKLKWVNRIDGFLIPLAKEICERAKIKYFEIYGPFGLESETSIYFSNQAEKESKSEKYGIETTINICNVETWSLMTRLSELDILEQDEPGTYNFYKHILDINLRYYSGKSTNDFKEGTIGYYNGLNDIYLNAPQDIDEIIKILRHSPKEKEGKEQWDLMKTTETI